MIRAIATEREVEKKESRKIESYISMYNFVKQF